MNNILRCIVGALVIATIFYRGGEGDLLKPILAAIVAILLVLLSLNVKNYLRTANLNWIPLLLLPPILFCSLQILPIGWHHPWLNDDLSQLGINSSFNVLSIEPGATQYCLTWLLTLSGLGILFTILFRGERVFYIANGIVALSGMHAFVALILFLGGIDWPSENFKTRGSFVYTNHAAAFWASCLPMGLYFSMKKKLWWHWASVSLVTISLLLSGSRGGVIIASCVCIPLILLLLPNHNRWRYAFSIAILMISWISLIGFPDLSKKFEALRGQEGLTLSGRITIWENAIPVALTSGPFGCGAGTTTEAYRRSGDLTFSPRIVDHLHNDLLEYFLEFGWLGLALGIFSIILLVISLYTKTNNSSDADTVIFYRGAVLGALTLGIYSFADFILHNPALDVLLIIFISIISNCQSNIKGSSGHRINYVKLACISIAIFLIASIFPSYKYDRDNLLAKKVGTHIYMRASNHLPLENIGLIKESLDKNPSSISLAAIDAWLYINLPYSDEDKERRNVNINSALNSAAHLSPGDSRAWAERAVFAASLGKSIECTEASKRALFWSRGWPDIQMEILNISHIEDMMPKQELEAIFNELFHLNIEHPEWVFSLANRIIDEVTLSSTIANSPEKVKTSGYHWLSEHGNLEDWIKVSRDISNKPILIPVNCIFFLRYLYGDIPYQIRMPTTVDDARNTADILTTIGLDIPISLQHQLEKAQLPWSLWAKPINLLNRIETDSLRITLRSELHHEWARAMNDKIYLIERIRAGEWSNIDRDFDPIIAYKLLSSNDIPAIDRQRIETILSRYIIPEWHQVSPNLAFSFIYSDKSSSHLIISNKNWTGIVLDGHWIGWTKGSVDLGPLTNAGLHRFVLYHP